MTPSETSPSPLSKRFIHWTHRFIFLAGTATIIFLIWHLGPRRIGAHIEAFGVLGFLAVLPLQCLDHSFNALAWRFAFAPKDAKNIPFWSLFKVRIAGDGVNYLTPSATVAGEFVRPGLLGPVASDHVKNTSVVIGKLSQTLGQMTFILVGIFFMFLGKLHAIDGRETLFVIVGSVFVALLIGFSLFILAAQNKNGGFFCDIGGPTVRSVRNNMREYLRVHPIRMTLSVVFFTVGYACGMIEVAVICSFMNLPIYALKALVIEALSNAFEAIMFMVPAKIGTQELGKVLIFKAMGYTARQGLSFAIIRHIREIIWSSAGFLIYVLGKKKLKQERSHSSLSIPEPAGLSESQIP